MRSIVKLVGGGVGLACLLILAAGCGVEGEAYQPRPVSAEKSVIYIYRPYNVLGSSAAPMITCGHDSIEMEPGGYYSFDQETGTVSCAVADDPKAGLKFEARPGEQYFIKEDVDGGTHFIMMDAAVGSEEIKDCRRQGIK